MEREPTNDHLAEIIDTEVQLNWKINKDEAFWEQRARVKWLNLGDQNTTFFHRYAS